MNTRLVHLTFLIPFVKLQVRNCSLSHLLPLLWKVTLFPIVSQDSRKVSSEKIVRRIQSITRTNTKKHPKYFHHAACWLAGLGTQLPLVKEFWLIIDLEANLLHLVNERSERLIELKEFMCVYFNILLKDIIN